MQKVVVGAVPIGLLYLLSLAHGACGAEPPIEEPSSPPISQGAEHGDAPTEIEAVRADAAEGPPEALRAPETDVDPSPEPVGPEPLVVRFEEPPIRVIDASILAHIGAIAERDPRMNEDRFVKMGGSSVESLAFLHCFAEDAIDLDGREDLEPTLRYFRDPASGGPSPFSRDSMASKVGWSIPSAMAGRPPYVHREITAMRPRWALAFFGGNDVQGRGRTERRFAERLDRLVTTIEERGVVPILASIPPRRRDPSMNVWVERYNRLSRSLARVHRLPYVDFHQALSEIPDYGLAGDGVHPGVLVRGNRSAPCDFSREGLQHGQNVRNLMVLQMLDQIRRVVIEEEREPAPPPPEVVGMGRVDDPFVVPTVPFAHRSVVSELPDGGVSAHAGCGAEGLEGEELVFRLVVAEPLELWVTALGLGEVSTRLFHYGEAIEPDGCLEEIEDADGELALAPGVHHVVVETEPERLARRTDDPRVLFMATPAR